MKCNNCGADIGNARACPYCGAQISYNMRRENEQVNKAGCPKCGSSNIQFNRENRGEVRSKKSKQIIHTTVGFCKDCGYTWYPGGEPKKKSKMWLWVLGWLCFFPIPLSILIYRSKLDKKFKIALIAALWIFLFFPRPGRNTDTSKVQTDETVVTTIAVSEAAESQVSETESSAEQTASESEPAVSENMIILKAGEKNEYSKTIIFNKGTDDEIRRTGYYVPAGKYTAKNISDYTAQINVYSSEKNTIPNGYEEPADGHPTMLEVGESAEIKVEPDYYIYISEPTAIELTPIN